MTIERYDACDWQIRQPWEKYGKHISLCGEFAPAWVTRPEDMALPLCPRHLIAYLFLYGPHEVRVGPFGRQGALDTIFPPEPNTAEVHHLWSKAKDPGGVA